MKKKIRRCVRFISYEALTLIKISKTRAIKWRRTTDRDTRTIIAGRQGGARARTRADHADTRV